MAHETTKDVRDLAQLQSQRDPAAGLDTVPVAFSPSSWFAEDAAQVSNQSKRNTQSNESDLENADSAIKS